VTATHARILSYFPLVRLTSTIVFLNMSSLHLQLFFERQGYLPDFLFCAQRVYQFQ